MVNGMGSILGNQLPCQKQHQNEINGRLLIPQENANDIDDQRLIMITWLVILVIFDHTGLRQSSPLPGTTGILMWLTTINRVVNIKKVKW